MKLTNFKLSEAQNAPVNGHTLVGAIDQQRRAFGCKPGNKSDKAQAIMSAFVRGCFETALLCGKVTEEQRSIVQMLCGADRNLEAITFIETQVRKP